MFIIYFECRIRNASGKNVTPVTLTIVDLKLMKHWITPLSVSTEKKLFTKMLCGYCCIQLFIVYCNNRSLWLQLLPWSQYLAKLPVAASQLHFSNKVCGVISILYSGCMLFVIPHYYGCIA